MGRLCLISAEEDTGHYTSFMRSQSLSITKNRPPSTPVSGSVDHKHQGSSPGFDAEHTVGVAGYHLDVCESTFLSYASVAHLANG